MKDRDTALYHQALIEVYMSSNQPEKNKRSEMNILDPLLLLMLSISQQA
jgi:hypothetical protein